MTIECVYQIRINEIDPSLDFAIARNWIVFVCAIFLSQTPSFISFIKANVDKIIKEWTLFHMMNIWKTAQVMVRRKH